MVIFFSTFFSFLHKFDLLLIGVITLEIKNLTFLYIYDNGEIK